MNIKKISVYHYLFIIALSIPMYFFNLNLKEADIMEARNFVTAREMVETGNYLIPRMNDKLRLEKPPVPTWLTASFMKIFKTKTSLEILRLPAVIITVFMIFGLYFLVLFLSKKRELALLSAIVLGTSFLVLRVGRVNSWDVYPYAFMLMALFSLLKGINKSKKTYFLIAAIFFGLSFMSKGPIAFYAMFIPFLFAYIFIYKEKKILENKASIIFMFILMLVLSFLWPVIIYFINPEILTEVVKKEAGTWGNKHIQEFYFYIHVFPYTGIWFIFSVSVLFRKFILKRVENIKLYNFSYIWFCLAFILLSLIPMKKERYGLPMYIPMAIMISQIVYYYIKNEKNKLKKSDKFILRVHIALMMLLSLAIPILVYVKGVKKENISYIYFLFILIIYTGLFLGYIYFGRKKIKVKKIILLTILFMLITQTITYRFFLENVEKYRVKKEYTLLNIRNTDLFKYPFYTLEDNMNIKNIWKSGKKIKYISKKDLELIEGKIVLIDYDVEERIASCEGNFKILEKKEYYKSKRGQSALGVLLLERE